MENDWLKKHIAWIILGGIAIMVLIPLGVAFMLSFRFIITDTTNEWIGFWGGYLGSILGGAITLFVMYKTLKDGKENLAETLAFEQNKLLEEKKIQFNDELLKQLVEYQTWLQGLNGNIQTRKIEEGFMDRVRACTILSKLIIIKLENKQDDTQYKYVDELLTSIRKVTNNFNKLVEMKNQELEGNIVERMDKQEEIMNKCIDNLMDDIETYYAKNR